MSQQQSPKQISAIPKPLTFRSPEGTQVRIGKRQYTPQIGRKICERLMRLESLKRICEDQRMPSMMTVTRWLADPRLADFREMYYYARRVAAELRVDEIFEIADDTSDDWQEQTDRDGNFIKMVPNNEAIQRSRVRIDTRKWYAAKMVPRIYGERIEHDHDVTGDLAELLKAAQNKDQGLPKPINGKAEEVG